MNTHRRKGTRVHGRRVPGVLLRILSAASLIVVLAGCGGDEPPSAAAPELGETLTEVDVALARGNYTRAEKALEELADEAVQAEQAGTISADDADRIVEAASKLLAQLPDDTTTSPAPVDPSPSEDPEGDEKEDKEEEKDKEEKDKGGGNGESEDNGSDGHGN
jgi:hypothetical protein